jgi:hypothetical protein
MDREAKRGGGEERVKGEGLKGRRVEESKMETDLRRGERRRKCKGPKAALHTSVTAT